jgi:Mu-like prophage I protein
MDGASTLHAFEQGGVKYLAQFYALDAKDLGQPEGDGTVPVWKHIASVGDYKGHPAGGFRFTQEAFDQIIRNFDKRETKLNVDYEHQTFNRGLKGHIPTAGWINKLELREDGDELWALLSLLPDAADKVRAKQARQCSPVIVPDSTDRNSGDDIGFELRSLALTNDPFLDGLHPFQLTRVAAMTEDEQKKADEAAAAKAKEDEAKKLAEPAAEGGSAADAWVAKIAEMSGSDADTVLAILDEQQDVFVKAVQDVLEKGGTPAENSDRREMRMMTITVGPQKPGKDQALEIAMKHKDTQITKLTQELAEVKSTVNGFVQAKAAAEAAAAEAALNAKVKSLQEQGFVGKTDQAFADAVKLYKFDPELAERTYSMATPPAGLEADNADPVSESGTNGKPLLMSQLTEAQAAAVEMLKGMGRNEKQALEYVAKQAASGSN